MPRTFSFTHECCSVVDVLSQGSAASTGYHSRGCSLWGLRRISANPPGLISDRVGLKAKSQRCVGAASVSLLPLQACDFALLYQVLEHLGVITAFQGAGYFCACNAEQHEGISICHRQKTIYVS